MRVGSRLSQQHDDVGHLELLDRARFQPKDGQQYFKYFGKPLKETVPHGSSRRGSTLKSGIRRFLVAKSSSLSMYSSWPTFPDTCNRVRPEVDYVVPRPVPMRVSTMLRYFSRKMGTVAHNDRLIAQAV